MKLEKIKMIFFTILVLIVCVVLATAVKKEPKACTNKAGTLVIEFADPNSYLLNTSLKEKISEAIANFVLSHDYKQSCIYLNAIDYKKLHDEAEGTELGRSFLIGEYGSDMCFWNLAVRIHDGGILIR
ncbi:hypothetical protein LCGC14_1841580 [marine sediment metagenome]|uniref:Uncharacterized protein n=1 Tax=marine sediment metagenome TaxID=412755 RepID=A0A0F9H191_9ZZZZ